MVHLYTSMNLYTSLVHTCTGLWLIGNDDQVLSTSLEKIFAGASFSDDSYRMLLLLDIWTLYLRYDTVYSDIHRHISHYFFYFFLLHLVTLQTRLDCCIVNNGCAATNRHHPSHKVHRICSFERYWHTHWTCYQPSNDHKSYAIWPPKIHHITTYCCV